ncbi:MAG: hypothetical protein ACRDTT_35475, partial [Pseudonocardiaceae bacterium]
LAVRGQDIVYANLVGRADGEHGSPSSAGIAKMSRCSVSVRPQSRAATTAVRGSRRIFAERPVPGPRFCWNGTTIYGVDNTHVGPAQLAAMIVRRFRLAGTVDAA